MPSLNMPRYSALSCALAPSSHACQRLSPFAVYVEPHVFDIQKYRVTWTHQIDAFQACGNIVHYVIALYH